MSAFVILATGSVLPAPAQRAEVNSLEMRLLPLENISAKLASELTTVGQWEAFLRDSGHSWRPVHRFEQGSRHPVVGVSRDDALAFCQWLTQRERGAGRLNDRQHYRLPFQMEWEEAAGISGTSGVQRRLVLQDSHLWGPQWPPPDRAGNFAATEIDGFADPHPYTSPVDRYPPTPTGLHDMAGNAWEWTMDLDARGRSQLRGGSWADFHPTMLQVGYQYSVPNGLRSPTVGFRVALDDRERTEGMMAERRTSNQPDRADVDGLLAGRIPDRSDDVSGAMDRILGSGRESGPTGGGEDVYPLNQRSNPNEAWRNSLGTLLVPVDDLESLAATHEVRVEEFKTFVRDAGASWAARPRFDQDANHPAVGMTFDEARAFCRWLTEREQERGLLSSGQGYRLPTDAEWTVMAAGTRESGADPRARAAAASPATYFGDLWPPAFGSGNFEAMRMDGYRDRFSFTAPVGSFRPNARKLYDIEGNVSEWVADRWTRDSSDQVARGGSWLTHERSEFAISRRRRIPAGQAADDVGFRYLLDPGINRSTR